MSRISKHWLQNIDLKFWLPLPLLALFFWFSCSLIAAQVLSRPRETKDKLQADAQLEIHMAVNVMRIEATIDQSAQMAKVEVQATDSILKKLEFEFPITDASQVEGAIAQELALPIQDVRQLVRYEIVD